MIRSFKKCPLYMYIHTLTLPLSPSLPPSLLPFLPPSLPLFLPSQSYYQEKSCRAVTRPQQLSANLEGAVEKLVETCQSYYRQCEAYRKDAITGQMANEPVYIHVYTLSSSRTSFTLSSYSTLC